MYYQQTIFDIFRAQMSVIIFTVVIFNAAMGGLSAWLASRKGYGAGAWFFLGLLFGVIAILAVGLSPNKTVAPETDEAKPEPMDFSATADYLRRMESFKKSAINEIRREPPPDPPIGIMTRRELADALGDLQAGELEELKKLFDGGGITLDEYETRKMRILGIK
jgi:hypothetical protein